jgi:hypothetical protein
LKLTTTISSIITERIGYVLVLLEEPAVARRVQLVQLGQHGPHGIYVK